MELPCNWQDKPRQIMDVEKHLIQLSGTALFDGDIAPGSGHLGRHGGDLRQVLDNLSGRQVPESGWDGKLYQAGADVNGHCRNQVDAAALRQRKSRCGVRL